MFLRRWKWSDGSATERSSRKPKANDVVPTNVVDDLHGEWKQRAGSTREELGDKIASRPMVTQRGVNPFASP